MIWTDMSFPYTKYNNCEFKTYLEDSYDEGEDNISHQIDYSEKLSLYRITEFKNCHWNGDIIFTTYTNAYCSVCNSERYIPDTKGYCCKCGHELKRSKECLKS